MGAADTREAQFRDFVAARSAPLLRLAYLMSGDRHLAGDLLQTTLARTYLAWRRLGGIGSDGADPRGLGPGGAGSRGIDSLEAYSRRVLLNAATSGWRRRWRGEQPTAQPPDHPRPDGVDLLAERDAVWRMLATLPARQRAVLVLRYYEDLTEAQTAQALGMSVGTVKSHASRALATLRTRMGDGPAVLISEEA